MQNTVLTASTWKSEPFRPDLTAQMRANHLWPSFQKPLCSKPAFRHCRLDNRHNSFGDGPKAEETIGRETLLSILSHTVQAIERLDEIQSSDETC